MTIVGPRTRGVFAVPPSPVGVDPIGGCVEALMDCARQCTAGADSCLAQDSYPALADCSAAALECADICRATAWAVTRHTGNPSGLNRALLRACVTACRKATLSCTGHDTHHRSYTQACRLAEEACQDLLPLLAYRPGTGR
jgi:hypothetical protein